MAKTKKKRINSHSEIKITVEMLEEAQACALAIRRFMRIFPNGAELTVKNAEKAWRNNLDVFWVIDRWVVKRGRDACNLAHAEATRWYSEHRDALITKGRDSVDKRRRLEREANLMEVELIIAGMKMGFLKRPRKAKEY